MAFRKSAFVLATLAGLVAAEPLALAAASEVRTEYSVSLIGLPVAKLSFVTRLDGDDYRISGDMRTSTLADIIEKTRGTAEVSGRIGRDRFLASTYEIRYSSGERMHRTEMRFRDGNLQSAVNTPDKKKPANWVPIREAHKKSVLDPLSSLVIPAGNDPCPRKLPIFDGEARIDLVLESKGVRPYSTKGFSGDAFVCSIRFVPQAGYRKGNKSIEYMRNQTGMEIWFGQHPEGGYFAPVYARVPTKIGPLIIAATRFGG